MKQLKWWMSCAITAAVSFALGSGVFSDTLVHAANDDIQFQLHNVEPTNSLLVYSAAQKTIYVYQGANTGSSSLQCSFKFILGPPGGVIRRQNCDAHALVP